MIRLPRSNMNKVPFQTFIFGALVADHLRPWCIFLGMLEAQKSSQHPTVTLWLFNIAMENGPFIDGLPIKNGDFPWLC